MTTRIRSLATVFSAVALVPALGMALVAQSPDARVASVSRSTSTNDSTTAAKPDSTTKKTAKPSETAPITLHIGDADLLIGGFMDATGVYRSVNTGSGIGSNFGGVPFSNTNQGNLAETRFSAQNSRLTLQATSKHGDDNLKGYVEADFLGNAPANLNVTSNANTLRMRLYWVQYSTPSWEVMAGQSWSLLTPNRNGVSPVPGDLFYSQDIDTNYQLGLTWGRTPQFRFTYKPMDGVSAAVSLENPQQVVGSAVVLPSTFPAAEVDVAGNTAAPNPLPDVIGKLAFDPKVGDLHQHFEVAGLYRQFKTYQPAVAAAGASPALTAGTFSSSGTGFEVGTVLEPVKNFRLVGTAFMSSGGGRYIANMNAPDFVINADGSISTVSGKSFIGGTEIQAMPNTLLYGYYSEAMFDKDSTVDRAGAATGFGLTGTASNKQATEISVGITQTFFRNPNIGGLQGMIQFSQVKRTPFAVPANTPSNATMNMFYFNLRYLLP